MQSKIARQRALCIAAVAAACGIAAVVGVFWLAVERVIEADGRHALAWAFAAGAASALVVALGAAAAGWRRVRRLLRAPAAGLRDGAPRDTAGGALDRAAFDAALRHAIARQRAGGTSFAVLCIDLDRFKDVHRALGDAAGDAMLRGVGERLRRLARHGDSVACLGGGAFAVLQTHVRSATDVSSFAQRIIDALRAPHVLEGRPVEGGGSVGAAIFGIDATDAAQLAHKAELALSRAKSAGHGTFGFYDEALDRQLETRRRLTSDLRGAIGSAQLGIHYQPLYAIDGSTLHGYEALLRWRHPERGPIAPTDCIRVAEEAGLIDELGLWVLRTACSQAAQWPEHLGVAVNLAAAQFRNDDLVAAVVGALRDGGLAPRRLEIEVTEPLLMGDADRVLTMLQSLSAIGVRIAIDDFGTGASSLAPLWRFPIGKVKVDRSLTQHLGSDARVGLVVKSIVELAHALKMRVNAEGVETPAQLQALRAIGCDELQGFLLGRPVPASALPHLSRPRHDSAWMPTTAASVHGLEPLGS